MNFLVPKKSKRIFYQYLEHKNDLLLSNWYRIIASRVWQKATIETFYNKMRKGLLTLKKLGKTLVIFTIGIFGIYFIGRDMLIEALDAYIKELVLVPIQSMISPRLGRSDELRFIIIFTTYQRSNKKSPYYVDRAVRSILKQKYRDWELYATGDMYENETEFKHIFRKIPANKLFLHNLKEPGERDKVSGTLLWFCVGATAMNNALSRAEFRYKNSQKLKRNKLVFAHLDDDDTWHPNHLQNLANAYKRFPTVAFVWSRGYYCASDRQGIVFPAIRIRNKINNHPPTSGLTLHSAVSWKMKTFLSFRYRRVWEYINEPPTVGDGDLWKRMTEFMIARNISFYLIPSATVEHLQERQKKPCRKADNSPLWYPDVNLI